MNEETRSLILRALELEDMPQVIRTAAVDLLSGGDPIAVRKMLADSHQVDPLWNSFDWLLFHAAGAEISDVNLYAVEGSVRKRDYRFTEFVQLLNQRYPS